MARTRTVVPDMRGRYRANAFEQATRAIAFSGTQPPEERPLIRQEFREARQKLFQHMDAQALTILDLQERSGLGVDIKAGRPKGLLIQKPERGRYNDFTVGYTKEGEVEIAIDHEVNTHADNYVLNRAEARQLRDWLNLYLDAPHGD